MPLSVFVHEGFKQRFYLKPPCMFYFKQIENQTAVDVKHSSHVKHRIRFVFDVNAKHRRTRNTAVMSLVMFLVDVFCACSTVCMAVDTCGQGWTTVDVCVAMFG